MFEKYTKQPDETSWRALSYFNSYRFIIAFLFVSLYWASQLPPPLGAYDRGLFAVTAHIYLAMSITIAFFIQVKQPRFRVQVAAQIIADIIIITIFMHASAGLNSGFGMLLIIVVAGGSILSPGRLGIMFAAIATLAMLIHETYIHLLPEFPPANYTHAGFLGLTFFVTAFICQELSNRVVETRALAEKQAADIENLSELNDNIVQRMQSGIVVVDDHFNFWLLNNAARRLLNLYGPADEKTIADISPDLYVNIRAWLQGEGERMIILRPLGEAGDIQVSFSKLSIDGRYRLILFIEDLALLRQRAQQIKLASLGRLTASIAHEVRNPLGAISHAGQLLAESNTLAEGDRRLTSIIEEHSRRVNRIVEDIMGISRRDRAVPVKVDMQRWLHDVVDEFTLTYNLKPGSIVLNITDPEVYAHIDSDQLRQVLWNLIENGVRYSKGYPLIDIECSVMEETGRPYIDVIDHGTGIDADDLEQLFEPFFTTSSKGSGLGLYIARELCEVNQASLSMHRNSESGCCFRIIFSHPEKQHSLV
jgi:two-component system sensor histidine kinase PilS (NtrC family)